MTERFSVITELLEKRRFMRLEKEPPMPAGFYEIVCHVLRWRFNG